MAAPRKPTRSSSPKSAAKPKVREKPVAKPVAPLRAPVAVAKPAAPPKPAPAPVRPPAPAPPPAPAKPVVPAFDKEWLDNIRQALLQRRSSINMVMQANQSQLAANEGDPSDIADRASDGFENELTAGLLSIEAAQLDEVDQAIARIEAGNYGICLRCAKPIPRKRLEVLPFAKRCLKCEGDKERSISLGDTDEDRDGDDEDEGDTD